MCGSTKVETALMTPRLRRSNKSVRIVPAVPEPAAATTPEPAAPETPAPVAIAPAPSRILQNCIGRLENYEDGTSADG
jgi:hypothetical protein